MDITLRREESRESHEIRFRDIVESWKRIFLINCHAFVNKETIYPGDENSNRDVE